MAGYNDLLLAKIFEGLTGGIVAGKKYKDDRDEERKKREAAEALAKAQQDAAQAQAEFNRQNTTFDNLLSLRKAGQVTIGRNPDGSIAYESQPVDAATLAELEGMLPGRIKPAGLPALPPVAGVGEQRSAIPSPSGIVPPPAPPMDPSKMPPLPGKVVNAPQPNLNITKSEFMKNQDRYRNNPNVKIIDDTEKATNAPSVESQVAAVAHLRELLNGIPSDMKTIGTGAVSKVIGGKRGNFGSNEIKQYEDEMPGTAVGLYRSLTGDTRLSDADAKSRALPYLPQVFPVMDTQEVREGKLQRIEKALQIKAQNPEKEMTIEEVMRQAELDGGTSQGLTPEEEAELQALEQKYGRR